MSAANPFAHLDDGELDLFCDLLTACDAGDTESALLEWETLPDALREKFARAIALDRIAQSGGLH